MTEVLFPYQLTGVNWLITKRFALLADEMGLGKSAQAIRAADDIKAMRILVICPAIARTNWLREFEKFSTIPRQFKIIFGTHAIGDSSHTKQSIIISYDLAIKFTPEFFGSFDLLIIDEVHYLKSIKTKRSQKILGSNGFVRYAKRIWTLSGTPAPNNASELWPLLYTFGAIKMRFDDFVEKFCVYVDNSFGRQITGTKKETTPELRDILSKVMLRRKADQVLDLKQMYTNSLVVDPEPDDIDFDFKNNPQFEKERQILEETFGHLDMTSAHAFEVLEGLAGSLSTIRRYVGLKKMNAVADIVREEISNKAYAKIVLFCIHKQVVDELLYKLSDFSPVSITGSTGQIERQANIDLFQNSASCKIFIANIQAAGTAITLTAANQCIFVEQDWVPGNNAQAAKRLHRIGQTKPVFIRVASLANSFDEQISGILIRKAKELGLIFD